MWLRWNHTKIHSLKNQPQGMIYLINKDSINYNNINYYQKLWDPLISSLFFKKGKFSLGSISKSQFYSSISDFLQFFVILNLSYQIKCFWTYFSLNLLLVELNWNRKIWRALSVVSAAISSPASKDSFELHFLSESKTELL